MSVLGIASTGTRARCHTPPVPSPTPVLHPSPCRRTCCTMEKDPVMRAWEAMMAARVATTTMGHSREEGTLSQYAWAAASGLRGGGVEKGRMREGP